MKMSNNEVTLTGFTGNVPETKYTGNGKPYAKVSLATSDGYKNKQTGEWTNTTTWHRIVVGVPSRNP